MYNPDATRRLFYSHEKKWPKHLHCCLSETDEKELRLKKETICESTKSLEKNQL